MESWSNTNNAHDAYIQWIEYSRLTNVQEMTSLRNGCTQMTNWLEPKTDELTRVSLKKIVDKVEGGGDQSFDFYRVNYFTCKQCNLFNIDHCCNNCIFILFYS